MLFDHKKGDSPQFSCITVFTTALCNLNCSYCYICKDKNGGLKQIDDDLQKCFDENFYIKQVLDIDPNCHNSIDTISLWGGEPFLGIYRFIDHIPDFFKNFPNITTIDFSTNMSLSDHPERLCDLVQVIEKNYYLLNASQKKQKIRISGQISIDGYKEMNDTTRGLGVTDKIYQNWEKFVNMVDFDKSKIFFHFTTKSTFSKDSWHFVDTAEKAFKWCESFDKNLYQPWRKSKCKVIYEHGFWNNAMPSEYSQKDGLKYAEVTKAFVDAYEKVHNELPSFKNYKTIVAEALGPVGLLEENYQKDFSLLTKSMSCKKCGMGCGVFSYNLVPIPNGKFTMCHRGLFDSYTDYINNMNQQEHLNGLANLWSSIDAKKYWIFDKEEILQMHNTINKLYEYTNYTFYTDLIQQVKNYADSGLIDSKYQNISEIEPTVSILLSRSQCIQDCFIFGGSWTTRTPLEIPLFYNGSMDLIVNEIKRNARRMKNEAIQ